MIKRDGDMFTSQATILAHGVNCCGVIGGGVSGEFVRRWPEMVPVYRQACKEGLAVGDVLWFVTPEGLVVANMATQYRPGPDARLDAIRESAEAVLDLADEQGESIVGIPMIGSDIGGLAWADVEQTLRDVESCHESQFEVWKFR